MSNHAVVETEWPTAKPDKAPTVVVIHASTAGPCPARTPDRMVWCAQVIDGPTAGATNLRWNQKHHIDPYGAQVLLDPGNITLPDGSWNRGLVRHEFMHAIVGVRDCSGCHSDSAVQGGFPGFGTWDVAYLEWAYGRWDCKNTPCN